MYALRARQTLQREEVECGLEEAGKAEGPVLKAPVSVLQARAAHGGLRRGLQAAQHLSQRIARQLGVGIEEQNVVGGSGLCLLDERLIYELLTGRRRGHGETELRQGQVIGPGEAEVAAALEQVDGGVAAGYHGGAAVDGGVVDHDDGDIGARYI